MRCIFISAWAFGVVCFEFYGQCESLDAWNGQQRFTLFLCPYRPARSSVLGSTGFYEMSVPTDIVISGTANAHPCNGITSDALPETKASDTITKPSSQTGVSTKNTLCATPPSDKKESLTAHRSPSIAKEWYTLRTTYGREQLAYEYIISHGGTAYWPTIEQHKEVNGKHVKLRVSRIPNIFFAYGTLPEIQAFVYDNANLPFLRFYYATQRINNELVRQPLVVPQRQMDSLRLLCAIDDGNITEVPQNDTHFHQGQEVRITQGPFAGIIGHVARYKGQQRVAVIIKDLITIATAYVPTAFLQPIE